MSAATIVLVHGNAGSSRAWGPVAARLVRATVVAPDLPGFGARKDAKPPTKDALAGFVDAVLREVPGSGRVVVGGFGAGSLVAGAVAGELLDRAAGLLLVGPTGVRGGHGKLGWLSKMSVGAALLRSYGTSGAGRTRFLADQLADPAAHPEACERLLEDLRDAKGFSALAGVDADAAFAWIGAITCPVEVLWGERDGVLPVAHAPELKAKLPKRAVVRIVEGAGHAVHLERPELVAERLVHLAR